MRLKRSTIDTLSDMICGNPPFTYFPYRSSSYLTKFFRNLDLEYVHDGTTRGAWVMGVLLELNSLPEKDIKWPTAELTDVITSVLDTTYFDGVSSSNYEQAFESMNKLLSKEGLNVVKSGEGEVDLIVIGHQAIPRRQSTPYTTQHNFIVVHPKAFTVPDKSPEKNLVSVMMPFSAEFKPVHKSIVESCKKLGLSCKRVDDIWENDTIIQDIFELIYSSSVVIADISGKNPNVLYEVGVAHTLGKDVILLTQNEADVPFDLRHLRHIRYLNNGEGLNGLEESIKDRLKTLLKVSDISTNSVDELGIDPDDLPF